MEKVIIDSSVALKWQFLDEKETESSSRILSDFVTNKIRLLAPSIFAYEIVSAIIVALSKGRISEDNGLKVINYNLNLGIELVDFYPLISQTFLIAKAYKISAYDSSYIALAQREECRFYTGNKRLFNSLRGKIGWIKWIGEYSL